ncbi:group II intron maturase-specific domain-containing protein, partial [Facklamia sp. P9177]|uniref:group II intron maturase-specific domain-containing protein n=2 Tax=unclassified Facklamia TaxID=2622293 RepID=UPI003D183263
NRNKSKVAHITKVKYLGYSFYITKGKCRVRVHQKSIDKMKSELKRLTSRSNGGSNAVRKSKLNKFIAGWINYFSMADMKSMLERMDEWLRRRVRQIYWKQWKKVRTRYKRIKKFGIPLWKVHEMANCRKATWRAALMLNSVLTKEEIAKPGYLSMLGYYTKECVN